MIHNDHAVAMGKPNSGLGYEGLRNAIAIEFDTWCVWRGGGGEGKGRSCRVCKGAGLRDRVGLWGVSERLCRCACACW